MNNMNYFKFLIKKHLLLLIYLILNIKCEGSLTEYINISNLSFLNVSDNPITFNLLINNFTSKEDTNIKDYKSLILNKNDCITYIIDNSYYIYNFKNVNSNTRYSEGWLKATNYDYGNSGLFSIHEKYLEQFNLPNSDLWDTSLDFIRKYIERDKECYNYYSSKSGVNYFYHKCKNYKASFNSEDFNIPSSVTKYFRLINNFDFEILVKVYKIKGSELNTNNSQIKNYLPNTFDTTYTWQTSIESKAIETIFQTDINYSGPFQLEIYNKIDSSLILTDTVKNIYSESKLSWFAKENTPTTILSSSLKNKSDYPYEFYTEIHSSTFK